MWKQNKFPIIEIIDSTFDDCKPIFQASWCGSIGCLREIVACSTTEFNVLNTKNSKNESILECLTKGKDFALSKIAPIGYKSTRMRFEECEEYILQSSITFERQKQESCGTVLVEDTNKYNYGDNSSLSSLSVDNVKKEEKSCVVTMSSFNNISSSTEGSRDEILDKLLSLYFDNNELALEYFTKLKTLIPTKLLISIETELAESGIVF